jgi:retinol dehydrogenase 12
MNILVTGASSGIGAAAAQALAEGGHRVLAAGRDPAKTEAVVARIRRDTPGGEVEALCADLSDMDQVRELARTVEERVPRLDALVLNAGTIRTSLAHTAAGLELTFATNHLGPFLLTLLLRDLLVRSAPARVVVVGSGTHRPVRALDVDALADGSAFSAQRTYGETKLANALFARELARRWAGTGVSAICMEPGFVRTDLGRDAHGPYRWLVRLARPLAASPRRAGAAVARLAADPAFAGVSGYFVGVRPVRPSALARDDALARHLWDRSAALVGGSIGDQVEGYS